MDFCISNIYSSLSVYIILSPSSFVIFTVVCKSTGRPYDTVITHTHTHHHEKNHIKNVCVQQYLMNVCIIFISFCHALLRCENLLLKYITNTCHTITPYTPGWAHRNTALVMSCNAEKCIYIFLKLNTPRYIVLKNVDRNRNI